MAPNRCFCDVNFYIFFTFLEQLFALFEKLRNGNLGRILWKRVLLLVDLTPTKHIELNISLFSSAECLLSGNIWKYMDFRGWNSYETKTQRSFFPLFCSIFFYIQVARYKQWSNNDLLTLFEEIKKTVLDNVVVKKISYKKTYLVFFGLP